MRDLKRINGELLNTFMKNFLNGLGILALSMVLSRCLPFYFAPVVGLLAAMAIYSVMYSLKARNSLSCALIPYAIFYCLISYSFAIILVNVLYVWNIVYIPHELTFFDNPYIESLLLDPISFIVMCVVYARNGRMGICIDCKLRQGTELERGKFGEIIASETRIQLRCLIVTFGMLSLLIWGYYLFVYEPSTDLNSRDWYVFMWLNLFAFILVALYCALRYYNIYIELKEHGDIISEAELLDMTAKTYIRYYVICDNSIYLNSVVVRQDNGNVEIVDTPFLTKRNVNGVTMDEVKRIVERLTNVYGGELRFIFGRRLSDLKKLRVVRYFYFLDGKPEDYADIPTPGEWVDFATIRMLYKEMPHNLSKTFISDISRVTTIILTQKLFDENGYRKIKTKSYQPTYNMIELREKHLDYQDDKWIRIALFNSDNRAYKLRKWFKDHFRIIYRNVWNQSQS
jgi:hypothetical protein